MAKQGKKITKAIEDKIISSKLLDDEKSLRDIAKEAWVSHLTVDKILDKAPELLTTSNTDGRTDAMLQTLDSIIDNGNKVIERFMRMAEWEQDEMIPIKSYNDLWAISTIQERSWKQKQILTWQVTDRKDVRIDMSKATEDQLDEEIKNLL